MSITAPGTDSYQVILERQPDGDYFAYVQELPGCVSHGDNREEALENIREAFDLYIEDCLASGDLYPQRRALHFVEMENPQQRGNFLECHPSPELPQALEKMGFVRRRERGRHAVFRREAPHASRLVITKGLSRKAIDEIWNGLTGEEQREVERAFLDNAPELVRDRYLAAQKEGGERFEMARRELIDGNVQKAARAAKRNAEPAC